VQTRRLGDPAVEFVGSFEGFRQPVDPRRRGRVGNGCKKQPTTTAFNMVHGTLSNGPEHIMNISAAQ
jgi:hypothetical protein